jgi:hypothetical protein
MAPDCSSPAQAGLYPLPLLAQTEARFGQRVTMAYGARSAGEIIIDFKIGH